MAMCASRCRRRTTWRGRWSSCSPATRSPCSKSTSQPRAIAMDPKRLADFDSLIGGYYGKNGQDTDPRKRVQDLLSTYYGNPAAALPGRSRAPSVSLSLGCDDGEVLSQPVQAKPRPATGQAVSLD